MGGRAMPDRPVRLSASHSFSSQTRRSRFPGSRARPHRGTAVQGGHGDAAADAGINGVDIVALGGEQLLENGLALAEDGGLVGVLHARSIIADERIQFILIALVGATREYF